jgi:hypothetical protein
VYDAAPICHLASFRTNFDTGYTARMAWPVLTVLLLIVTAWFCLTILPDMIDNMLSGKP